MREMVIYCERGGDAFWAEPLNALSSLAFLLAAVAAWRACAGLRPPVGGRRRWDLLLLSVLIAVAGVGSFLWHTLATPWAEWADVVPVLLFFNLYVVSFLYRGAGLSTSPVLVTLLVFQWAMAVAWTRLPAGFLDDSAFYLPIMFGLWLAGFYSAVQAGGRGWPVTAAAGFFTVSLALLSLDLALCPLFPAGTHFLWHLLSALTLYLLLLGLARMINNRQFSAPIVRPGEPVPSAAHGRVFADDPGR